MKSISNRISLFVAVALLITSCHSKKTDTQIETMTAEEVVAFAKNLENKVMEEDPDILNQTLIKDSVLKKARQNEKCAAYMDSELGESLYNRALDIGAVILKAVRKGGEYKYLGYYVEQGVYHAIFRTYSDYSLKIDDYILKKVNDTLRIQDVYLYNFGQNLSDYVVSDVLYHVEKQDKNTGVSYLDTALIYSQKGQYKQMLQILKTYKNTLSQYPYFDNLYLMALYNADKSQYLPYLDTLKNQHKDARYLTMQQYSYYLNEKDVDNMQKCANEMIKTTGKDVIYDFLLAEVYQEKSKYAEAEQLIQKLEGVMNPIWDYWDLKLRIYYALNNETLFKATLLSGKDLYAYTNQELIEILQENFPKYASMRF